MKALFGLSALALILAAIAGWIMNIFAFIGMLSDPTITPMLIGRGFGIIVAPLGAILGWF